MSSSLQLDVKTTAGGAITISKTTQGKTVLTTKKKTGTPKKNSGGGGGIISKNVTKTVSRAGIVSLKTKNKTQATLTGVARGKVAQGYASAVRKTAPTGRAAQVGRTASAARPASAGPIRKRAVPANTKRNLTRTIQGRYYILRLPVNRCGFIIHFCSWPTKARVSR